MKLLTHILFFFLLVTQFCFAQWVQLGLEDKAIIDIAVQNSNIFAVTSDSGSMYRSTDNGSDWTVIVDTGAINIAMASTGMIFLVKESEPVWGYPTSSLFSSSNNGDIWDTVNVIEQLPPVPGGWPAWPITVSVNHLGLIACGIYVTHDIGGSWTRFALSTDDGSTWILSSWDLEGGILFDFRGQTIITFGGTYVSGGSGEYINLSYDNGQTWFERYAPYPCPTIRTLNLCLNGNVLGGTFGCGGLYLSADSCTNWTQISSVIPQASLSIETGGTLVGTENLGVFLFSDNGDSLGSRNDGLTNLNIHTLTIDNNNYVYAGTDNGVWQRSLSDITSAEEEQTNELPSVFLLSQNFPNPFNPSTKIKYSVPQSSQVQIKVFDVLGNEIARLMDEEKSVGTYELTWNAENLPSGVYFYQLRAGDFIQTKKMILLR